MTSACSIKPDPPESVNQEFWLGKKMQEQETKKPWKLQKTFLLLPKAKNAAFAATAHFTFLGAAKWCWASKIAILSVIIEQSATSAKRSLLISFCKMLLLVLLYQLHLSSTDCAEKKYFSPPQRYHKKNLKNFTKHS